MVAVSIPSSDPGFRGGVFRTTLISAELLIDKNLTIIGPGSSVLTIQRNGSTFNGFTINSSANVAISGLSIQGGAPATIPTPINAGIISSGTLNLANCAVSGFGR